MVKKDTISVTVPLQAQQTIRPRQLAAVGIQLQIYNFGMLTQTDWLVRSKNEGTLIYERCKSGENVKCEPTLEINETNTKLNQLFNIYLYAYLLRRPRMSTIKNYSVNRILNLEFI